MLSYSQKCLLLKMELAVVIDNGRPLVEATYVLKGIGPLLVKCYEEVNKVLPFQQHTTQYKFKLLYKQLVQYQVILVLNRLSLIM